MDKHQIVLNMVAKTMNGFCNQELFSDRALCMICQKPEETSGTLLSMMTGQSMLSVSEKMEISPSLGH